MVGDGLQGMERRQAVVSLYALAVFVKCERFWELEELSSSSKGPCCMPLVLLVVSNNTSLQNFAKLDNNTGSYVLSLNEH
jgi:hypothetical protein